MCKPNYITVGPKLDLKMFTFETSMYVDNLVWPLFDNSIFKIRRFELYAYNITLTCWTAGPVKYFGLVALFLNSCIYELRRLQTLINTSARTISGRSRFNHITDFVKDVLHWLLVTQRVHLEVCTLVYKVIQELAPMYFSDFLVKSTGICRCRDLRSSAHSQPIPASHCRQFIERAFAVVDPVLWN